MTVSTIVSRVTYSPGGSVTEFAIPFPFYQANEIEVIERVIATGTESTKVLGADYTISGGAGATGTVTATAAPAATVQWVLRRATARTQEIDYVENDPFPAETHEEGLDRAAMRVIDMAEEVDRAPKFPVTDPAASIGDIPNSVARASKALTFDAAGKPTATAFGALSTAFDVTVSGGDAAKPVVVNPGETGLEVMTNAAATRTAIGAVPSTRDLIAGAGLIGGGALSADVTFNLAFAGLNMVHGTLVASVAAGALTIAIKTKTGTDPTAADPVTILFRNAIAATGDYTAVTLTAATSFVVSSGSTLGATSATAFRLWIVGFNDGGTFRLGVINALSGKNIYPLGGWPIASATAEGGAGAADSAYVFYAGAAVTSKAYTILGHMTWETGLTTAGTWDAVPTRIHLHQLGNKLPGDVVQTVVAELLTAATGLDAIPDDDTIPQSSEGDQFLAGAITPTSAANLLDVDGLLNISSTAQRAGVGLFKDAVADALAFEPTSDTGTSALLTDRPIPVSRTVLAAGTAAITFKLRAGPLSSSAGTITVNGTSGTRKFGGALVSHLKIKELMT